MDESAAPSVSDAKKETKASEVEVSAVSDTTCLADERLFVVCNGDMIAVKDKRRRFFA